MGIAEAWTLQFILCKGNGPFTVWTQFFTVLLQVIPEAPHRAALPARGAVPWCGSVLLQQRGACTHSTVNTAKSTATESTSRDRYTVCVPIDVSVVYLM